MSMLVVEPDNAIRRSLCEWLRVEAPGWSISEATSKEEAIVMAEAHSPRMILVDVADPETDGLMTIREIKDAAPESHIVALVMRDGDGYRHDLAAAGASACVLIWKTQSELIPKMRALLSGGCRNRIAGSC